ncbi:16S rRNA processing protein RimM [Melghirimyces profundicolus]|uniref:Ribosome maturation factor RimM n=1 Tax=Melghirimyces profundicolus TaxID=1242148 RepID=A0A2T6BYZ0_9BACL|nr:ribosome maturation factor RimM [Melghirimyces profundicolus]PTX61266.1 16S rRNA processing protein RimM [Melghirimyces profundicolus]
MREPNWLTVGHIAGTHGIRGEVRILSRTDYPEVRFAPGAELFLSHPKLDAPLRLTVKGARPHKRFWLIRFEEWTDINEAEPFKGGTLMVPREDAVEAEGYYLHEIIGCEVVTTEGEKVGTVTEILQPGANDVWVVKKAEGGELLLPFIDDVVKDVDPDAGRVTIRWMEGLE